MVHMNMLRLLKIEYLKLKSYKAFWLMFGFYVILLLVAAFAIPELIDYIGREAGEAVKSRIFSAVIFNFPDVWQNVAFVASIRFLVKMILGFIVIIIITNEFNFLTIRSNIIAGLSRKEYLLGKLELLAALSLASTLVIVVTGFYLGMTNSVNIGFLNIFSRWQFLGAYFLEVFTYLSFVMLISMLIKKMGLTIIIHTAWMIAEPIISYKLPEGVGQFLPFNAMNNLLTGFNSSLIKVKVPNSTQFFQDNISLLNLGVCLAYLGIFVYLSHLSLKRRDL